jgi:hypothetical protein
MKVTGMEFQDGAGIWHGTSCNGVKKYMWYYRPRTLFSFTEQDPSIPNCWMNAEPPEGASELSSGRSERRSRAPDPAVVTRNRLRWARKRLERQHLLTRPR